MDKLYNISLKMLKDKHNLDEYPRDKFNIIYYQIFNNKTNNNLETNDLNKLVLKKINESILSNNKKDDIRNDDEDDNKIEAKINELRNIRNNMNLNTINTNTNANVNTNFLNNNDSQIDIDEKFNEIQEIRNNMINTTNTNINTTTINNNIKYKTFIINSIKNNFTTNINKTNIYPLFLCLPSFIKKLSPYIILSITDNYNNIINYTFIYNKNSIYWDIWKPVIKAYNKIILENTNWNIKLFDFNNNLISLNDYYSTTIEILENNNYFNVKIDKIHLFNLNDKIKIIFNNNHCCDNIINDIDIENETIQINKNNINIQEFINSKIFNYNYQLSLIFKYN